MKQSCSFFVKMVIFLILAIITQVGAVTYVLGNICWYFLRRGQGVDINKSSSIITFLKKSPRLSKMFIQCSLYGLFTFIIVPNVAPLYGREPIAISDNLQPANYWLTVALNRNYVVPSLNNTLVSLATQLKETSPNIKLYFLDANFPFLDHYPLLPHLSHNDGKKVDLSYIYEDEAGNATNLKPSRSGYGVFEPAKQNEKDTTLFCKENGYFQYDYPKYFTLGTVNPELIFSTSWNKKLINNVIKTDAINKIFIEPHLVQRLHLESEKIRFHGCRAVRHDDHIHIQL